MLNILYWTIYREVCKIWVWNCEMENVQELWKKRILQCVLLPPSWSVHLFCRRCWLSVDNHFIWSFIGPVTFIIMVSCFIFLWILRLTEWGRDWEAEMKDRDKVREMVELKEKSDGFLLLSLLPWWQVNFAPKTDLEASDNSPCLSLPDKDLDLIVYFNLTFTHSCEVSRYRHWLMGLRVTLYSGNRF